MPNTIFSVKFGNYTSTTIRAPHDSSAEWIVDRAIRKTFGGRYFWFEDSGLGFYHGQVFEALRPTRNNSNPGNSSATPRIRIDIHPAPVRVRKSDEESLKLHEEESANV